MTETVIVGAGMAGCLVAYLLPGAHVIERAQVATAPHRAVLRFRTEEVSRITRIPFRRVRVHKAMWADGRERRVSPRWAMQYARKVIGAAVDRSIWDLKDVTRWVAPPDFHRQMLDHLKSRITYGRTFELSPGLKLSPPEPDRVWVSTIPLPTLIDIIGVDTSLEFTHWSTVTYVAHVAEADAHLTVYFPEIDFPPYRATLTGDRLSVECMCHPGPAALNTVADALGLPRTLDWDAPEQSDGYGKILPVADDRERRALILEATLHHNVYCLGRFGTWRNLLLDDLPHDVDIIRSLIAGDRYGHMRKTA